MSSTSRSSARASTLRASLAGLVASAMVLAPIAEPIAHAAPEAQKAKPDGKKAAEIAVRAVKLYREGKHKEAAELFLQAYDISRRPAQLRNAAKAYEEGGMLDDSLALWTRYRDHEGVNDDEKAEAVAHIQLVNEKKKNLAIADSAEKARQAAEAARVDAERAREAAVASEKARRDEATRLEASRGGSQIAPWALVGTGGAALVAGGVVWLLASSRLSSLDDKIATTDGSGLIVGTSPAEVESEVSGVNTMRLVSGVLLAVGVAAAGSGAAWLLLGGDSGASHASTSPSVSITPVFAEGHAGIGAVGTF